LQTTKLLTGAYKRIIKSEENMALGDIVTSLSSNTQHPMINGRGELIKYVLSGNISIVMRGRPGGVPKKSNLLFGLSIFMKESK